MNSLTTVFLQHYKEVLAFLTARTGSRDIAQDCAQDTWIRLKTSKTTTMPSNGKAYIYRVAANIAVDWYRANQHEQQAREKYAHASPTLSAPDTLEIALANETIRRLEHALMQLPARSVQIFIMHRHEGKTYGEIARQLKISVSAVEKHMMRLLLTCHAALET